MFKLKHGIYTVFAFAAVSLQITGCAKKSGLSASVGKSASSESTTKVSISCRPNHAEARALGTFGDFLEVSLQENKKITFEGAEYMIAVGGYQKGSPVQVVTEIHKGNMVAMQLINLDPDRGSAGDTFVAGLIDNEKGREYNTLTCNASYNQ